MSKQNKQKTQFLEPKEEETNWQKCISTLYRMFVREEGLSSEMSQALVSASYFQIFGLFNIIALFTIFSNTNSQIYSIVISCLVFVIFLVDIIPKISQRHFVFNFVSITQGLILIGVIISSKILLDNYFIFVNHCNTFIRYHENRDTVIGPRDKILQMCSSISTKFIAEITVEAAFVFGKIIHVGLYIRAYRQAKQKFDQEEKKRRRKDRYNEMMRRRCVFNEKRKA